MRMLFKVTMFFFVCVHWHVSAKQAVVASYYSAAANPQAVSKLPAEKLSHILYAFIAICGDNEGAYEATKQAIKTACIDKAPHTAVLFNEQEVLAELAAFERLKQQHPHLRLLPSIGGWTLSQPFHDLAKSDKARQHFVQSAVDLIAQHDVFDGIDIDWEYPGGGGASQVVLEGEDALREKRAFTLMMQEFREKLDALSQSTKRQYLLTAAVTGSQAKVDAIDWKGAIKVMDYVFAMTYDFAVGDGAAAHHTNLFARGENALSGQHMINNLLDAGVPPEKLVLGMAFYGRGWTSSGWQKDRFGSNAESISTGFYIYKDLMEDAPAGYEYGYDEQAQAAYFYNQDEGGFISFDDVRSVSAKTQWAKNKGLAGVFSWQIMQDNGDLLDAMHRHMHENTQDNSIVPARQGCE